MPLEKVTPTRATLYVLGFYALYAPDSSSLSGSRCRNVAKDGEQLFRAVPEVGRSARKVSEVRTVDIIATLWCSCYALQMVLSLTNR